MPVIIFFKRGFPFVMSATQLTGYKGKMVIAVMLTVSGSGDRF